MLYSLRIGHFLLTKKLQMKNIISEIKIKYNPIKLDNGNVKITSSDDAFKIVLKHWNPDIIELQEEFKVLLLNNSNKVKGIYELSTGSITGTMVDLRILFAVVLKSLSVGIIISHNHPSNKLEPSEADKRLTEKIKKAAQFFDIMVLDHLIITPDGNYYSFADNGDL